MTAPAPRPESAPVAVLGAGPAGLTAAYRLARRRVPVVVFEAGEEVGGLARTVVRDGYRFDLGGHRFFTKSEEVEGLWEELLGVGAAGAAAALADLLARSLHRVPAAAGGRLRQGRPAGAGPQPRLLRPGPAACGAGRTRPTRSGSALAFRPPPLRALLQDLHGKGLGRGDRRAAGRVGGAADRRPLDRLGAAGGAAGRRGAAAEPDRGVPLPAPRARADVGGAGAADRAGRR